MEIHKENCKQQQNTPSQKPSVQLSCDGVSECKSTNVILDVYSCKAIDCDFVYPLKMIRPLCRYKDLQSRSHLGQVVDNLMGECQIVQYVADNPKRAIARDSLQHNSSFPYEYCFAKGCNCKQKLQTAAAKAELESLSFQINLIKSNIETEQRTAELKILKSILLNLEKKTNAKISHQHCLACINKPWRATYN